MFKLSRDSYFQVSGLVFLIVAVLHALRAFNEWDFTFNNWDAPVWFSWVVAILAIWLAYNAKRLLK